MCDTLRVVAPIIFYAIDELCNEPKFIFPLTLYFPKISELVNMNITLNLMSTSKNRLYTLSCKGTLARLFSLLFVVLLVFSLLVGVFAPNAKGQTPFTVEKVSIKITTGANTYLQGDLASFQMTSNTTPTGKLYVYDSIGELHTILDIRTTNWFPTDSGDYAYKQLAGSLHDALIQIPVDAHTGTWQWNATINDTNEQQTYTGTFTVNLRPTTPTPTLTPTPTPEITFNGNEEPIGSSVISLWVLLGLFVVGLVCIFIFIVLWGIRSKRF